MKRYVVTPKVVAPRGWVAPKVGCPQRLVAPKSQRVTPQRSVDPQSGLHQKICSAKLVAPRYDYTEEMGHTTVLWHHSTARLAASQVDCTPELDAPKIALIWYGYNRRAKPLICMRVRGLGHFPPASISPCLSYIRDSLKC